MIVSVRKIWLFEIARFETILVGRGVFIYFLLYEISNNPRLLFISHDNEFLLEFSYRRIFSWIIFRLEESWKVGDSEIELRRIL